MTRDAQSFTTIISVGEMHSYISHPDWAIFDCRFDLKDPEWGYSDYLIAHIPGSIYAHMDKDLSAPITPQSGRHPLPDVQIMADRLSAWGITNRIQVVVYDTTGGAYAVRLWWLLRFLGHSLVAVLDGGFQAWQQAGFSTKSGIESRPPSQFIANPNWSMVATTDEVERIYQDTRFRLIDARAPERFRGEIEPIDFKAGHIPGAINRFHGENLYPQGRFLPPARLREQFLDLIGDIPPERVIMYCGSGVTSCHHILAMEMSGLPGCRLYAGSWSEWIRNPDRPIE